MSELSTHHGSGWHAASEAEINKITRGSRPLIMTVALCLLTFILWASWCELDEITRGEGKVIPSSQVQHVQNMEGGIIEDILVSEGDLVEKEQVLMIMDDTRFTSTLRGQLANRNALMARRARLLAEVEGGEPVMPETLTANLLLLADREKELFHHRQLELSSSIGVYQQQLTQQKKQALETKEQREMLTRRFVLLDEELQLARDLAAEGAVSRVEVLRLERQVSDTRGEKLIAEKNLERIAAQQEEIQQRINEIRLNFVNKARVELNETLAQLHELTAKETAVSDQVERTRVKAPMKGVVKQILVNTEGGVVQPGMVMMDLIPVDDTLEVEARIRPQDIAFLHPGQKATVRFTAYDFTIHGGLDGELTHISADTIMDEQGESFYLVRIKTDNSHLGREGDKSRPIIVGMVASVDILTGKKTLLEYLLKPVLRARQLAFSER